MSKIGVCFDRSYPAAAMADYARRAEAAGLDQLWVIEDCFYTSGVSLAATALGATEHLEVGLGVLPVVARNPAVTAMELATLANIAPGRLVAGMGHGVQEWMGQMGERVASPLTVLEETFTTVRRLLAGESVTFDGRYVRVDDVRLDQPPSPAPPLIAGVRGPRSMAVAGRVADGVLLAEAAGPEYVEWARRQAAGGDGFTVDVYAIWSTDIDRNVARRGLAPMVEGFVRGRNPAMVVLPFFDELAARVEADGAAAIEAMPDDYWLHIGAIGNPDDALAFIESMRATGVRSINLFPGPALELGHELIDELGVRLYPSTQDR